MLKKALILALQEFLSKNLVTNDAARNYYGEECHQGSAGKGFCGCEEAKAADYVIISVSKCSKGYDTEIEGVDEGWADCVAIVEEAVA